MELPPPRTTAKRPVALVLRMAVSSLLWAATAAAPLDESHVMGKVLEEEDRPRADAVMQSYQFKPDSLLYLRNGEEVKSVLVVGDASLEGILHKSQISKV